MNSGSLRLCKWLKDSIKLFLSLKCNSQLTLDVLPFLISSTLHPERNIVRSHFDTEGCEINDSNLKTTDAKLPKTNSWYISPHNKYIHWKGFQLVDKILKANISDCVDPVKQRHQKIIKHNFKLIRSPDGYLLSFIWIINKHVPLWSYLSIRHSPTVQCIWYFLSTYFQTRITCSCYIL